MFQTTYCSTCGAEGFSDEFSPPTFSLQIRATHLSKKCNHTEEESNWWWFCSSVCLRDYLDGYSGNSKHGITNKITYMEEVLKFKSGEIEHKEFLENTKEL